MAATTASETREVEDMGMPRQRKGHSERHGEGYGEGDLNSLKRIPPAWAGAVVAMGGFSRRIRRGSSRVCESSRIIRTPSTDGSRLWTLRGAGRGVTRSN